MKQLGLIAIDQYGQKFTLKTNSPRKELLEILGYKSAQKMYVDTKGGQSKHVGYIIGGLWLTIYNVCEWSKAA